MRFAIDQKLDARQSLVCRTKGHATPCHPDLVLRVEREIMLNQEPTARAQRQALDVLSLARTRRPPELYLGSLGCEIAHGATAHSHGGGHVSLDQRRRAAQCFAIVEAMTHVIRWQ